MKIYDFWQLVLEKYSFILLKSFKNIKKKLFAVGADHSIRYQCLRVVWPAITAIKYQNVIGCCCWFVDIVSLEIPKNYFYDNESMSRDRIYVQRIFSSKNYGKKLHITGLHFIHFNVHDKYIIAGQDSLSKCHVHTLRLRLNQNWSKAMKVQTVWKKILK